MDASSSSEVISPVENCTQPELNIPPKHTYERTNRTCCHHVHSTEGQMPLACNPSILLHVLTNYGLDPQTLATLEVTCAFFKRPARLLPDTELSITEVAALDMCYKRAIFKPMSIQEREYLKQRCGGSWKLVLRFLLAGEICTRREQGLAVAGPGHSVVVERNGDVYSFGSNSSGELGNGTTEDVTYPCKIRSLRGIRIIQATAARGRTVLISDTGRVYECGKRIPGEMEVDGAKCDSTPQLIESLKHIFIVQVVISNFFTAFLSREGDVYTVSWGKESKLAHGRDLNDLEARRLVGALENVPVVQIAAGYCFLLALAFQPCGGMSVYSVGCGLGGKLGHGTDDNEKHPRLIQQFTTLNLKPKMIAAGPWHSAVLGEDGRICTWGWGRYGCLGHNDEEPQFSPKVVEALTNIKAVHIAIGEYRTFVVSEDGDVYTFGFEQFYDDPDHPQVSPPQLMSSLSW